LTKCHSQGRSLSPLIIIIIIIIINKVLIKVTLNKVIAGTLHSYMWLKHCESTGLTVNSRMTIETDGRRKHSSDGVSLTAAGRLLSPKSRSEEYFRTFETTTRSIGHGRQRLNC